MFLLSATLYVNSHSSVMESQNRFASWGGNRAELSVKTAWPGVLE